MPHFKYKALRKEDNESYEAIVEATDRFEVYGIVRKEGGQVVSVEEVKNDGAAAVLQGDILKPLRRVKMEDKILLTRNLGAMLNAGLSLSRALSIIKRQSKNTKLQDILAEVIQDIEQGGSLSGAMKKHPKTFSTLVTSMVAAGEEAGTLSDSLLTISEQLKKAYDLKKKVRGAMIYPSVILSVLVGVGVLMMMYIVPTLAETFEGLGTELPASTQLIMTISNILVNYTLVAFGVAAAVIVSFIMFVRTPQGKRIVETALLHVPVIGELIKETNSARTGRTLSSLLSSGVNVVQAMTITEDVLQNTHFKEVLAEAKKRVQTGTQIAEVFIEREDLYPPLVGELISVGEETGNLPDMLHELATFYEKEVEQKTKNMSTIIEPMLMLIVGLAVGYFAVAMISPIYGVAETF